MTDQDDLETRVEGQPVSEGRPTAARNEVVSHADWRCWAQFVFLGGGAALGPTADLRHRVCEAVDARERELQAEIATLRQQDEAMRAALHQWAIYCFTKHGNDAHLYNGLADLAGSLPAAGAAKDCA